MEALGPALGLAFRALCRIEDVPDGAARGFPPPPGGLAGLFVVRRGGRMFVYVNACPHLGVSLDWAPDKFLTLDGSLIMCATHGAEFRIEDGHCLRGPCAGDTLEQVAVRVEDGTVFVPADAGL